MHPGFCPQCGERVTPYAAGCALCGADLDPHRRPPSLAQRLSIRLPRGIRVARLGRSAKVRVRP
jgi:predicted amidophosphoribosyltransferase